VNIRVICEPFAIQHLRILRSAMKYYIIAGEASGDLHGSNLIKELKKLDTSATIRCWGGDKMQQAGGDLVKHYRELAFMGFWEVIKNIFTILRNLKFCKKDIEQFQPDTLILIDYPGFNLRIAKWAKQKGLRIIYYISPQVWAWKENRVKMMKKCIDKMIVILPFEKDYFKNKWNWEVEYVGHPLVDIINESLISKHPLKTDYETRSNNSDINGPIVAVLPGSRKQEILKKLPVMLEVSKLFHPQIRFVLAKAPGLDDLFYDMIFDSYKCGMETTRDTYNLLTHANAALVTSGTATLETALFAVPEVVCYKGSFLSYEIGRRLVKVKFISLVNLIMDKLVVKELIQHDMNVKNLEHELHELLTNEKRIAELRKNYADLKNILSEKGNASSKAAQLTYAFSLKK
jgi:lipid-A-disaccharide synthase